MFNSFRGGIYPPQRKTLTMNAPIMNLPVPQVCYIPMLQHDGEAAKTVVKKGDTVSEGELIGLASGDNSVNVHASVPGKVIDIIESRLYDSQQTTVLIEAEGAFTTTGSSHSELIAWRNRAQSELLEMIRTSGIAGLGGDASPTAVKLTPDSNLKIDTLIVNGSESEPYITSDDILMNTYPREIIEGIQITLKITGISSAIIAIEDNKKRAVKVLTDAVKDLHPEEKIVIKQLRSKYPQGSEKQLVYTLLNRIIPHSEPPQKSGVVVINISTIYAIREAVLFNKPLIDRVITISGDMINKPGNYKVRFGTRISEIIEECGGLKGVPCRVVVGGPMRGFSVDDMELPVVKSTTGILFLSDKETCNKDSVSCIRCGKCVSVCPSGLIPRDIAGAVEKGAFDRAALYHPEVCIKCSCCSYVCPAKRPLSYLVNIAMGSLPGQKK